MSTRTDDPAAATAVEPNGRRQRGRRTQEERSAETRGKLLDATIACLVEEGYAATTGRRVAERAGVTRGAQTHHFPHRLDLIVEAVERLGDRRAADLRHRARRLPTGDGRPAAVVDLVIEDFASDLFRATVEIWVASAHDRDLHDRLVPFDRRLRVTLRALFSELLSDEQAAPAAVERLDLAVSAIRGLALAQAFEPRDHDRRVHRWTTFRPLLVDLVAGALP